MARTGRPITVDRTGEIHTTNEGYEVEIIGYEGWRKCVLEFKDKYKTRKICNYKEVKNGGIKNPYHPSVCGIGYFGEGKYNSKSHIIHYETWRGVIRRCYDEKHLEKHPTYKDCSVDERWHNFQVFAEWFEDNHKDGWELDKDLLIKGNKTYSPETCCFVPNEINIIFVKYNQRKSNLLIGVRKQCKKYQAQIYKYGIKLGLGTFNTPELAFEVYKTTKEQYIKEVADKWKDQIAPNVYEAMYNYKVEITD